MTIAVIADDFTGAAELAAVAWRHGLSAEVHDRLAAETAADVVAVNTASRSLPDDLAAAVVAEKAAPLAQAKWVYKKTDSVLRGPVLAELEAALHALKRDRALLCPANPSLGRVIRGGHYLIDGIPLDQTPFTTDAEYPATTSEVLALLGTGRVPVELVVPGQRLPPRGVIVGQAENRQDLATLAGQVDLRTLPAGGAEFFAALLQVCGYSLSEAPQPPPAPRGATLWVCGSASAYAAKTLAAAEAHGVEVLPMPSRLLDAQVESLGIMESWAKRVCATLEQKAAVVVAIGTRTDHDCPPPVLTERLTELAATVLERAAVGRVYVEGGATAWALAGRMGWRRFAVLRELAPGVVALRPANGDGPVVTMKPGSYDWGEEIWP